jgi:hypothetical protein
MHAMAPVTYDKPRLSGECTFVFGQSASFLKERIAIFLSHGATAPSGSGPLYCRDFTFTPRHTRPGRTPLDKRSARRRELYLTT